MVLLVIMKFLVCHILPFLLSVVDVIYWEGTTPTTWYGRVAEISNVLIVLNSASNILVYFHWNSELTKIRNILSRLLTRHCICNYVGVCSTSPLNSSVQLQTTIPMPHHSNTTISLHKIQSSRNFADSAKFFTDSEQQKIRNLWRNVYRRRGREIGVSMVLAACDVQPDLRQYFSSSRRRTKLTIIDGESASWNQAIDESVQPRESEPHSSNTPNHNKMSFSVSPTAKNLIELTRTRTQSGGQLVPSGPPSLHRPRSYRFPLLSARPSNNLSASSNTVVHELLSRVNSSSDRYPDEDVAIGAVAQFKRSVDASVARLHAFGRGLSAESKELPSTVGVSPSRSNSTAGFSLLRSTTIQTRRKTGSAKNSVHMDYNQVCAMGYRMTEHFDELVESCCTHNKPSRSAGHLTVAGDGDRNRSTPSSKNDNKDVNVMCRELPAKYSVSSLSAITVDVDDQQNQFLQALLSSSQCEYGGTSSTGAGRALGASREYEVLIDRVAQAHVAAGLLIDRPAWKAVKYALIREMFNMNYLEFRQQLLEQEKNTGLVAWNKFSSMCIRDMMNACNRAFAAKQTEVNMPTEL